MQFSDKKPTVSGKIVWGDMAIRAQVVAPPIVEGGMAITFRPFKVSADQLIQPRLLHGGLVDLDAAGVGCDQTNDHIKTSRFASAIWAKQADDFAAIH